MSATLLPSQNHPAILLTATLLAATLLTLLPGTVVAGAGGAELQATYDMLIGWMTGLLGRIIAIACIVVGLIAGVARQCKFDEAARPCSAKRLRPTTNSASSCDGPVPSRRCRPRSDANPQSVSTLVSNGRGNSPG